MICKTRIRETEKNGDSHVGRRFGCWLRFRQTYVTRWRELFLRRKNRQNPAHRCSTDLESTGDLGLCHAGAMKFPNLSGLKACGQGRPRRRPFLPGVRQPSRSSFLPLATQSPHRDAPVPEGSPAGPLPTVPSDQDAKPARHRS